MSKTATLTIRLSPDVKSALETVAKAEDRSVSAQTERILREWLLKNGHLKG